MKRSIAALVAVSAALAASSAEADKAQIRKADEEFCALAQHDGILAAFRVFAAPDAAFLDSGGKRGAEAVKARLSDLPPGTVLTWSPSFADASSSGDLGYTSGAYVLKLPSKDGEKVQTGHYCTVWKRQPDGSWKYVLDAGEPDPPASRP